MPAEWLYQVGPEGLLVYPEIVARARSGDRAALRAFNRQKLTKLYRASYTRPRRPDAIGMFWADVPPLELIPFVRGRNSPRAWLKDYVTYANEGMTKREATKAGRLLKRIYKHLSPDEHLSVGWTERGTKVVATMMKPNPKFELVVVNRHDRAALLKLLAELDGAANVEGWLASRTSTGGSTLARALHTDYAAWCAKRGEVATGIKSFAQALVAAGVQKLTRSRDGERYSLTLK